MIRIEKVSKHFRKDDAIVKALEEVSLEIPKGSLALVRGP